MAPKKYFNHLLVCTAPKTLKAGRNTQQISTNVKAHNIMTPLKKFQWTLPPPPPFRFKRTRGRGLDCLNYLKKNNFGLPFIEGLAKIGAKCISI